MIVCKCIHKFRNEQGKIYGYRLIDLNNQTQDVTPDNLKMAILNKQVEVVNLTLTSDGRLIDAAQQGLKNEQILGKPPVLKVDKVYIGTWQEAITTLKSNVALASNGMLAYTDLKIRRLINGPDGQIKLLAMAIDSGNKPIVVLTPNEFYVTDKTHSVKYTNKEDMKEYLMRESGGGFSYGRQKVDIDTLNNLSKLVCNIAKTAKLGDIQCKRYDKKEDEDGYAIFITNYKEEDFRYRIMIDVAESGVIASMNIKDTPLINYNRINSDLTKEDIEVLMKYLAKAIEIKRMNRDTLYVTAGKIWDIK